MQAGVGFKDMDENQVKVAAILYEYEETKKQLALKSAEAARLALVFSNLGEALSANPACVSFRGDTIPLELSSHAPHGPFSVADFDAEKVREVTKQIRELELRLARIKKERTDLGYPVST
jgi:hypothetical protein